MEAEEPPVPAGLNELTPALKDFIEIFEVNKDLLKVAAQTSEKLKPTPDLSKEIKKLSREDCEYFLTQVLEGKPNIDMVLRQKLSTFLPQTDKKLSRQARTLKELLDGMENLKQEESQREAAQAEKERIQELKKLAIRKEQVWKHIDDLINLAKAKYYNEAIDLLIQLKELSIYEGDESVFQKRLKNQVSIPYKRKSSLKQMLIEEFNSVID